MGDEKAVNLMLQMRIASVVGMRDFDTPNLNIGKVKQQQFDISDNVGWDPATRTYIDNDPNNKGLFRPCFNSFDIHNTECHYVPEGTDEYTYAWVQNWAKKSYWVDYKYGDDEGGDLFPFTGRGWTFDWQGWNHYGQEMDDAVGCSEFVIPAGSKDIISWKTITPLEHVCNICQEDPEGCGLFYEWAQATGKCGGNVDKCYGATTGDNVIENPSDCMKAYLESVDVIQRQCKKEEFPEDPLPGDVPLMPVDVANDGQELDIVYLGCENMERDGQDKWCGPEIWVTLAEDNATKVKAAVTDLILKDESQSYLDKKAVNLMLQLRIASVVGMRDFDTPNLNIGKVKQQQFDISDNVGWDPATRTYIDNDPNNKGLFRPCFNSFDIHNTECHYVPEGTDEYTYAWVQNWAKKSYWVDYDFGDDEGGDLFPFTGRGWTFDWQGWNHNGEDMNSGVGCSEFVIPAGSKDLISWVTITPLEHVCNICKSEQDGCGSFYEWAQATGHCGWLGSDNSAVHV